MRLSSEQGVDFIYDYYAILDVERTASVEEIRKAYQQKIKTYHLDRFKDLAQELAVNAQHMSNVLNEAEAVLSNPQKRAVYDRQLAEWTGPISTSGTPIAVPRYELSIEELLTGEVTVEELTRQSQDTARQLSGYSETIFSVIEAQFHQTSNPSPELKAAYDNVLHQKEIYLAILETKLGITIGLPILSGDLTNQHRDEVNAHTQNALQKVLKNAEQRFLALQQGDLLSLAPGESSFIESTESNPNALAEYQARVSEAFEDIASKVREMAGDATDISQKRLSLLECRYIPEQAIYFDSLFVCLEVDEKRNWFRFLFQDGQINGDSTVSLDTMTGLENIDNAAEAFSKGSNVMFVTVPDGVDIKEALLQVAIDHFTRYLDQKSAPVNAFLQELNNVNKELVDFASDLVEKTK